MRSKALLITVALVCLLLTGCGNSITTNEYIDLSGTVSADGKAEKTVDVTVFYKDDYGYIVPVVANIPWSEGIAKAVIRKMMSSPELQRELVIMGLESLMPSDAVLNGIDISNGLAKIDFKSDKLTFDNKQDEELFVKGVVLALTAFPTVDTVQFMFNGHVIDTLPKGTPVGSALKATDVNARGEELGEAVTVYYHGKSNTNFDYCVPVTVYMNAPTCQKAIDYMLTKDFPQLTTGIPQGTKLLEIEQIGDTVCLFFSEEFRALAETPEVEAEVIRCLSLVCGGFYKFSDMKIYAGSGEYLPQNGIEVSVNANVM